MIEVSSGHIELTLRQRWAHYLTLIVALLGLMYGFNLRDSALNATARYVSTRFGIEAFYPANWLLDTQGDYIFRVRDMTRIGFKTAFQVSLRPAGSDMTERNVLESLSLRRLQSLSNYAVLSIDSYIMPDESEAVVMLYTYVTRETGPFLQGVPSVVLGLDVLQVRRGQAVVITYRADASIYDEELARFEQFLSTLDF